MRLKKGLIFYIIYNKFIVVNIINLKTNVPQVFGSNLNTLLSFLKGDQGICTIDFFAQMAWKWN
jgi:hypothetical protein